MTYQLSQSLHFCTVCISDCTTQLQNVQKSNAEDIIRNWPFIWAKHKSTLWSDILNLFFCMYQQCQQSIIFFFFDIIIQGTVNCVKTAVCKPMKPPSSVN